LVRDGATLEGTGIAAVWGRVRAVDFAGFVGRFATDRLATAGFATGRFAAAFFEDFAGCFLAAFLVARLTVFFAAFPAFFGARAFVVVLMLFSLRLLVLRTPAFLPRALASEARPVAARDLRVWLARDFPADFFLAGATTNSL
jgi:hypothetical protein